MLRLIIQNITQTGQYEYQYDYSTKDFKCEDMERYISDVCQHGYARVLGIEVVPKGGDGE